MKTFIELICPLSLLFVSAYSLKQALIDELHESMQKFATECFASENANEADLEDLMVNKRPPRTHEGKCAMFCVIKKLNLMKDDGSYGEGFVEWLAKVKVDDPDYYSKLMNLYDVCQSKVQNEEDFCEKAAELGQCAIEEGNKRGLFDYFP